MAKVVKSTREVLDVEKEIEKATSDKKVKNSSKKKDDSKKNTKKDSKKKTVSKKKKSSFIKEVREETSKVKWPSRKDMVKYSAATIYFVLFFGIFFYLITVVMTFLKELV